MRQSEKTRNNFIFDMLDDDFISINDENFREIHVCEEDIKNCLLTSQYHFKTILDAVEYLEENKIDSYLISICCKKDSK